MKVVAVERKLENLKNLLESRGYKTVFPDENNEPVYAYIYCENSFDANNLNIRSLSAQTSTNLSDYSPGTLIINANGKSFDEIISILERRIYSPLF